MRTASPLSVKPRTTRQRRAETTPTHSRNTSSSSSQNSAPTVRASTLRTSEREQHMTSIQHFTLTPATDRNVTARIAAAYTAAGITAPTTFVPALKRYMAQLPAAQQVAATLAHDAYHADPDTDP